MRHNSTARSLFGCLESLETRRVLSVAPAGIAVLAPTIDPIGGVAVPVYEVPTVAEAFVGDWAGSFVGDAKGLVQLVLRVKEVAIDGAVSASITLTGGEYFGKAFDVEGSIGMKGNFSLTWQENKGFFGTLEGKFYPAKESIDARLTMFDSGRTTERTLEMSRTIYAGKPEAQVATTADARRITTEPKQIVPPEAQRVYEELKI